MTEQPTQTNHTAPPVRNAEFKAALLLFLMVALVAGAAVYLMYARGAFEPTQRLVLTADDSEGVTVGMDVTFAGFPIGRVQRIDGLPEAMVTPPPVSAAPPDEKPAGTAIDTAKAINLLTPFPRGGTAVPSG